MSKTFLMILYKKYVYIINTKVSSQVVISIAITIVTKTCLCALIILILSFQSWLTSPFR